MQGRVGLDAVGCRYELCVAPRIIVVLLHCYVLHLEGIVIPHMGYVLHLEVIAIPNMGYVLHLEGIAVMSCEEREANGSPLVEEKTSVKGRLLVRRGNALCDHSNVLSFV